MLLTPKDTSNIRFPGELKDVKEDGGISFWNQDYLERFHKMTTRLKCFQDLDQQIFRRVPEDKDAEVLEMCSGSGRNAQLLFDRMNIKNGSGHIWAVDFSLQALVLANKKLGDPERIIFKEEDVKNMHFKDNSFDYVFDIFGSTYIPNKEWKAAIEEVFRVLKPGGYAYFLYWLHGSDFGKCFRSQILTEFLNNPMGLYWALHLKVKRGLNLWDQYVKKGDVVYPTERELTEAVKDSGGNILGVEKAFLNTCSFVWAKKE